MTLCRLFAVGIFVSLTACATLPLDKNRNGGSASLGSDCPQPQSDIIGLVGHYKATVSTDEGWSGSAQSTVSLDTSLNCMLAETTQLKLLPTDADPINTLSTTTLSWDSLEEVWKVISIDDRGYTHIARGGKEAGNWVFQVVRMDGRASTRRIVYRTITDEGYVWVWQGRASEQSEWKDRLAITYERVK